jgi:hypothetical protein
MSTYSKVRKELAEQHASEDTPPCRYCGTPTASDVLTMFGARCGPCYRSYRESVPERPPVAYARDDRRRSWAWNLKARHEGGERLTPAQVTAYTAALRSMPEDATA